MKMIPSLIDVEMLEKDPSSPANTVEFLQPLTAPKPLKPDTKPSERAALPKWLTQPVPVAPSVADSEMLTSIEDIELSPLLVKTLRRQGVGTYRV